MKVAVVGLWHLGCVTAACVAEKGYSVIGIDPDVHLIGQLENNCPPVSEPGLSELMAQQQQQGRLSFSHDFKALQDADLIWITFDTPVNDQDQADVAYVEKQVMDLFPYLNTGSIVLISSQLPVGTTHKLQRLFQEHSPQKQVCFAYSPENLRLGKSINYFLNPERIVIGLDQVEAKPRLEKFLNQFSSQLIWMRVTSAEMTKHALNAFLAVSVTFANEMARICKFTGADAFEVEQGLKSEARIGPGAYLRPGEAFAGGTLARDVNFLCELSQQFQFPSHIFPAILASNQEHKHWIKSTLLNHFLQKLAGKKIAILGLTYKPDTDTLRRSEMVELIDWLNKHEAIVTAYDPWVRQLPEGLNLSVTLSDHYHGALVNQNVVILGTRWPQFKDLTQTHLAQISEDCVFIDATGFLEPLIKQQKGCIYYKVGCHDVA